MTIQKKNLINKGPGTALLCRASLCIIALASALVFGCGRTTEEVTNTSDLSNIPPRIINITHETTGASAPMNVSFSAQVQDANEPVSALTFLWDFGDGTTSNAMNPTHRYTYRGTFDYSLTVHDSPGASDTLTASGAGHPLEIIAGNQRPAITTCTATPPTSNAGIAISFYGEATDDGTLTNASYVWDFGDGVTASGQTASHPYVKGVYAPKLTVTDSDGAAITKFVEGGVGIDVNLPPVITALTCTPNNDFEAPITLLFDCEAYDVEGKALSYVWNIENREEDGYTTKTDTFFGRSVSFNYTIGGNFNVYVTVTDTEGGTTTSSNYIIITDDIE